MRITTEQITLKDGRTLTLRSPELKDASKILDCMKQTAIETHFLINYPEEIEYDINKEQQWIQNTLESPDRVNLCVFDKDRFIANCGLHRISTKQKLNHRASLGISIIAEYCNSGLGSLLLQKAINKGKEMGFRQIELELFSDNTRALHTYQKAGFHICGCIPRGYKLQNGSFIDCIQMVYFIE